MKPDSKGQTIVVRLTAAEAHRLNELTAQRMLSTHRPVTRSTVVREALEALAKSEAAKAA